MPFYIQNVQSGLVLDIRTSCRAPSAAVILYNYTGTANQLWEYRNNMIQSKMHGLVLDVSGTTGDIIMYPSHGGPNQKWYFDSDGTIRSGNGRVVDVHEGRFQAGTKLIAFNKHGGPNQKFRVVPV